MLTHFPLVVFVETKLIKNVYGLFNLEVIFVSSHEFNDKGSFKFFDFKCYLEDCKH